MTEYVTNRLHFITNIETILKFIRSGHVHDNPPPEFSFNSVKPMPDELFLPLDERILTLSGLKIGGCNADETTKQIVLSKITLETPFDTLSESEIPEKIDEIRKTLNGGIKNELAVELFEKAVSNYTKHGFFSHYDWRFVNWGTVEDVHSVTESTFHSSTTFLEFETRWTPPIAAVQILANTFPSVRFKLKYRSDPDAPWKTEDIFAFPPFGY